MSYIAEGKRWLIAMKARTVKAMSTTCWPSHAPETPVHEMDHALRAGRTIQFRHPFRNQRHRSAAGAGAPYEVITDEEMIEGLSFASFPARRHHDHGARRGPHAPSSMEMISISAIDSRGNAQRDDASAGTMNDNPVDLDKRRGMAAQKATDIPPHPRRTSRPTPGCCATIRARSKSSCWRCRPPHGSRPRPRRVYVLNIYAAQLAPRR